MLLLNLFFIIYPFFQSCTVLGDTLNRSLCQKGTGLRRFAGKMDQRRNPPKF